MNPADDSHEISSLIWFLNSLACQCHLLLHLHTVCWDKLKLFVFRGLLLFTHILVCKISHKSLLTQDLNGTSQDLHWSQSLLSMVILEVVLKSCTDPEGWGTGGPDPPMKNHKNIGFSSNTGPDPLFIAATKLAFNDGPSSARQRNAI